MTHHGWRKPTPELVRAEKFALAGEGLFIPKNRAIVAAKKVAVAFGLKAQDQLLLDTFAAVTQSQDWEEGRRPIVWVSNEFLMLQTGFSLTTLKRHVRRLLDAGFISFKDSSNGKRYGHRGEDGHIREAYGFDLAPLAARTEEFEELHAQIREERALCASLRKRITITRRIIRAKIEKAIETRLEGPWQHLALEFEQLLANLPGRAVAAEKLIHIADMFSHLKDRTEEAFTNAFDWPEISDVTRHHTNELNSSDNNNFYKNMDPIASDNGPHILTTNQPNPVKSNSKEQKNVEISEQELSTYEQVDDIDLDIKWNSHANNRKSEIDIPTLMVACPHFAQMARDLGGGYIHNWNDLHRVAFMIRGISGISEDAWAVANKILGPEVACVTIALIFDKQTMGEVKSAGGYLRAMIERAQKGELHLDRSLFGRLNAVGMNAMH